MLALTGVINDILVKNGQVCAEDQVQTPIACLISAYVLWLSDLVFLIPNSRGRSLTPFFPLLGCLI